MTGWGTARYDSASPRHDPTAMTDTSTPVEQRPFSHARLEQAIYRRVPLRELIGREPFSMGDYVIADFVGSHQIDRDRFGPNDLIQASARIFFEDQGAFMGSFEGAPYGKAFNLVVFATFVVVEIAPFTPRARFLVLTPNPESAPADSPYAGLMRTHNTDALREQLEARDDLAPLMDDLEALLLELADDRPGERPHRGLWQRLFGR